MRVKYLVLFLLFLSVGFPFSSFSQQVITVPPTIPEINTQLEEIQQQRQRLAQRLNILQANQPDNLEVKNRIIEQDEELKAKKIRLEKIKFSIEEAQHANVPAQIYNGELKDNEAERIRLKQEYAKSTTAPIEKIKIKRADYNAFPPVKQKAIQDNSDRYEIID